MKRAYTPFLYSSPIIITNSKRYTTFGQQEKSGGNNNNKETTTENNINILTLKDNISNMSFAKAYNAKILLSLNKINNSYLFHNNYIFLQHKLEYYGSLQGQYSVKQSDIDRARRAANMCGLDFPKPKERVNTNITINNDIDNTHSKVSEVATHLFYNPYDSTTRRIAKVNAPTTPQFSNAYSFTARLFSFAYGRKTRRIAKVECDNTNSEGWTNLGTTLRPGETATVCGTEYTSKKCYAKAVEYDNTDSQGWYNLGTTLKEGETATVCGTEYTKKKCYTKALE